MVSNYLFINGEVITVNQKDEIHRAVAVKGREIIAVGSTEEILRLKDENSKVIDLKGRTLLPGFIESHLHISLYGTNQLSVSCKEASVKTISDLLEKLKEKAKETPKGEWVRAWGYNDQTIADGRFPTKEELDTVSTEHPIMVVRACNHISTVNSYGLQLASIDKNTPDPEGGKIVRGADGEPNGLLLENAHMQVFQIAGFTRDELQKAHSIASGDFAKKGITTVHDATGYGVSNIEALKQDSESGIIKQRVYAMVGALNGPEKVVKHFLATDLKTKDGNDRFKYGPVKLFLDGSSSGPTIWTREPYDSDPNNYGIHYYQQEEIEEIFIPAHQKGWQITSHAQGDAAIDMLLTCIEKANSLYPREDARHRIEHAGIAQPDLIERMKKQGVIPTPNPAFFFEYGDIYIKNYGERSSQMYPLQSYIEAGVPAAIASDCPVTDFNPLRGIHSAITRIAPSGSVLGEKERIGLLEAIRMITWNGAYASFSENETGSIEAGKLADIIILDRSILQEKTDEIPSIQVVCTMIDGEIVYAEQLENEPVI